MTTIRTEVNRPYLPPEGATVTAEVEVEPGRQSGSVRRQILLLVDTSGSMEGEKMDQARVGAGWVFGLLEPDDYVGIVEFETEPRVVMPFTQWGETTRQEALEHVDRMEAGGGTDLYGGLETALAEVEELDETPVPERTRADSGDGAGDGKAGGQAPEDDAGDPVTGDRSGGAQEDLDRSTGSGPVDVDTPGSEGQDVETAGAPGGIDDRPRGTDAEAPQEASELRDANEPGNTEPGDTEPGDADDLQDDEPGGTDDGVAEEPTAVVGAGRRCWSCDTALPADTEVNYCPQCGEKIL